MKQASILVARSLDSNRPVRKCSGIRVEPVHGTRKANGLLKSNKNGGNKMAYQEEQTERQRMVVETPNSRREVRTEAVRYPDRSGLTSASLAAIVVGVVVLVAITLLFFMYRQQDTTNSNVASQQPPQTTVVQQPA